jgi:hypothetical protein
MPGKPREGGSIGHPRFRRAGWISRTKGNRLGLSMIHTNRCGVDQPMGTISKQKVNSLTMKKKAVVSASLRGLCKG